MIVFFTVIMLIPVICVALGAYLPMRYEKKVIKMIKVGQTWSRKIGNNPFEKRTEKVVVDSKLEGWVKLRYCDMFDTNGEQLIGYMSCLEFVELYNLER